MDRRRRDRSTRAGPPDLTGTGAPDVWRGAEAGPDAVVCLLCNREFRAISCSHLRRIHDFQGDHPIRDYKALFGLETAVCRDTRRTLRRVREDYWERHGQRWTHDRVLSALRNRAAKGQPMHPSSLGARLNQAARRRFGTWDLAMRRAGFDPDEFRVFRSLRWSPRGFAAAVHLRRKQGRPLSAAVVEREDEVLYRAAFRLHGCWGAALRAVGLDPEVHRVPRKWCLENTRAWLREQIEAGRLITASRAPVGAYGRARREVPGGWAALVESMGVPYPGERHRLDWSNDAVIAEIRRRKRAGLPLNRGGVAADSQAVIHQACKRFGSWDAALQAAGVDPSRIRLHRTTWTRAGVLAAIRKRHASGRPMSRAVSFKEDRRLVKAAQGLFPASWAKALAAAGLDPALVRARTHPPPGESV